LTEHRDFQLELAAYTAGRLEGESRLRLEAHLKECDECREMASLLKEFGQTLRDGGETLFEAHPSPASLMEHARRGTRGGQEAMVRHLESCAACRLEVDGWTRAAMPGRSMIDKRDAIRRMVWPLAAGVVLGLGLATFARMAIHSRPAGAPGVPTPASVAGPMLVLPRLQRGSTERVVESEYRAAGFVVVACPAPVPEEASPEESYAYVMKDAGGNVVWSTTMNARSIREHLGGPAGVVVLLVPAASLPPGHFEFTLSREGSREEPFYRVEVELTGAR